MSKISEDSIKFISDLCQKYESQIEDLKKENEFFNNFSPAEPLLEYNYNKDVNIILRQYWEEFKPKHEECSWPYSDSNKPNFIKNNYTIDKIQVLIKLDESISVQNNIIINNNKEKHDKIMTFFKRIKLPEKTKVVHSTRARYPKTTWEEASWIKEIRAAYPVYDNWNTILTSYNEKIKFLTKYEHDKNAYLVQQENIKTKENNKNKHIAILAGINIKYQLSIPPECLNAQEVLHKIILLNKYLYLGHYLNKNRNDWNDGHRSADVGLRYFNFQLMIGDDSLISEDIQDCINNWDGDGRVFRDTKYNYSVLFSMVEKELINDYNVLMGIPE